MMKKNKILLVLGCLSLGVGVIGVAGSTFFGAQGAVETKAADVQAAIWDFTAKSTNSTSYTNRWDYGTSNVCTITGGANNNGGWAYIRTGGKGAATTVTGTSTMATKTASAAAYTKILLTALNITSGSGFTMTAITLTVASNSDFSTIIDTVSGVTVATSMTWTPTTGTSWPISSFYKLTYSWSSTNTSNRGMDVQTVKFIKEGTVVNPTSVSVTLASSTLSAIGAQTNATATISPDTASDKTVTWSSSNENVAVVDAQGVVTAVGNGNANITATSNAVSSVTGSAQLTVSGIASATVNDKTITVARLGFGTSYVSGIAGLDNVSYKYENVMKGISYNDCLQFKAGVGVFQNALAYPSPIKRITIINNSEADIKSTLTVGTSTSASTATTFTRTASTVVYDIASLGSYSFFKLADSSSNADYLKAIVVELISSSTVNADLDNARAFATTFLEQTATECASLAVTSSNWSTVASLWEASFKTYFSDEITNGTYAFALTDIQKATERYSYIVKKYGYTNFMNVTLAPAHVTPFASVQEDASTAMYVLGGVAILASSAFFLFRKKKHE